MKSRAFQMKWWALALGGGLVAVGAAGGGGSRLYVDRTLAVDCFGRYDPGLRSCRNGMETGYTTLEKAAKAAQPGDTVLLRAGIYPEALVPARSGSPGQLIIFKAYGGEEAILAGADLKPAIDISDKQYLVIERLTIRDVTRWLYAVNAHHNIIRNSRFLRAMDRGGSSKTGLFFQDAQYNRIVDNHIEDSTQDSLSLVRADRNVVEGNVFLKSRHTLWAIKCGSFNVIRRNYFHNEQQKIGEIYDCHHVGMRKDVTLVDATRHNLVEDNVFAYTPSSGHRSPYAGIQYAGQKGIIRFNRFYDTTGPGLDLALYSNEALYNKGNRVYHNVFYGTRFAGVRLARGARGATFSDNIFKNNVLAKSRFVAHDRRWPWYVDELAGKAVQLMTGRLDGFAFAGNVFFATGDDKGSYLITYGVRNSRRNPEPHPLRWWQSNYAQLFHGNSEQDPLFVNEDKRDFRPRLESPLIDAGVFLTRTMGAGSGRETPVEDVGYFFDGFDIPGEAADLIQLEGMQETARVIGIDYESRTLIVDRALSWREGQGVHLAYSGSRPDIGAYESRGGR